MLVAADFLVVTPCGLAGQFQIKPAASLLRDKYVLDEATGRRFV